MSPKTKIAYTEKGKLHIHKATILLSEFDILLQVVKNNEKNFTTISTPHGEFKCRSVFFLGKEVNGQDTVKYIWDADTHSFRNGHGSPSLFTKLKLKIKLFFS